MASITFRQHTKRPTRWLLTIVDSQGKRNLKLIRGTQSFDMMKADVESRSTIPIQIIYA